MGCRLSVERARDALKNVGKALDVVVSLGWCTNSRSGEERLGSTTDST